MSTEALQYSIVAKVELIFKSKAINTVQKYNDMNS